MGPESVTGLPDGPGTGIDGSNGDDGDDGDDSDDLGEAAAALACGSCGGTYPFPVRMASASARNSAEGSMSRSSLSREKTACPVTPCFGLARRDPCAAQRAVVQSPALATEPEVERLAARDVEGLRRDRKLNRGLCSMSRAGVHGEGVRPPGVRPPRGRDLRGPNGLGAGRFGASAVVPAPAGAPFGAAPGPPRTPRAPDRWAGGGVGPSEGGRGVDA